MTDDPKYTSAFDPRTHDSTGKPVIFSAWMQHQRNMRKWDLKEASIKLRLGLDTLERLESGRKSDPRISTFRKIVKVYGGTLFALFGMYEREFPQ